MRERNDMHSGKLHRLQGGMVRMNIWQQKKRSKQRAQILRENISYRQNMRELCRNEKNVERIADQYAARAVEAERMGNHALAVRMAAETAKMKKYLAATGNMRGSLEIAHAIQSANYAVTDIHAASASAAGSMLSQVSIPDMCALQADLISMQEHAQAFMEQYEALCEDDEVGSDVPHSEEGERFLAMLMASVNADRKRRLLHDTNIQLERLYRDRPLASEGGK